MCIRDSAWFAPPPPSGPTLVWSHGNGGNIGGRAEVLLALVDAGVGVLAYDYRGYGKSGGRPSEAGVYRDVLAAYDALRVTGIPAERLVAFGESLGDEDEVVPYELGTALYAAAPEPKRFLRATGAHHNDVFGAPGLIDAIATFAREVTGD